MTTQTTQFEIPAHRIEAFEAIVAKIARKAAKLELSPITFEITGERTARTYRIAASDERYASVTYRYVPADDAQPTVGTIRAILAMGYVITKAPKPTE